MSETGAQVLAAAAVIGRSFDPGLVRATSGRTEDETVEALDELLRRGLVREVGDGDATAYDFAHARLPRRRVRRAQPGPAPPPPPPGRAGARRGAAGPRRAEPAGPGRRSTSARRAGTPMRRRPSAWRASPRDTSTRSTRRGPTSRRRSRSATRTWRRSRSRSARCGPRRATTRPPSRALEAAAAVAPTGGAARRRAAARPGPCPTRRPRDGGQPPRRRRGVARGSRRLAAWDARAGPRRAGARRAAGRATRRRRDGRRPGAGRSPTPPATPTWRAAAHRVLGLAARDRGDLATAAVELERSLVLAADEPDGGPAIAARNALALVRGGAGRPRRRRSRSSRTPLAASPPDGRAPPRGRRSRTTSPTSSMRPGRTDEAMAHLKRAVALFAEVGGRPGELEPEIWKLVTW